MEYVDAIAKGVKAEKLSVETCAGDENWTTETGKIKVKRRKAFFCLFRLFLSLVAAVVAFQFTVFFVEGKKITTTQRKCSFRFSFMRSVLCALTRRSFGSLCGRSLFTEVDGIGLLCCRCDHDDEKLYHCKTSK